MKNAEKMFRTVSVNLFCVCKTSTEFISDERLPAISLKGAVNLHYLYLWGGLNGLGLCNKEKGLSTNDLPSSDGKKIMSGILKLNNCCKIKRFVYSPIVDFVLRFVSMFCFDKYFV